MRRKQLYAIILAGALAASSAPAAVFAAEGDVAATAETSEENPVDGETAAATEAPAEETPADTTAATEAPAEQAPAQEAAAATEAPAQEAAPAEQTQQITEETPAVQETPAAETSETTETEGETEELAPGETTEQTAISITLKATEEGQEDKVRYFDTLQHAIDAAPSYDAETAKDATVIEISGQIALDATVTVPANKKVCIRATNAVTITRTSNAFTDDMFEVTGENAELQFDVKEGAEGASFTVSGKISDEESDSVEGSIVSVGTGAAFGMDAGVTLKENNSSANGGAITNVGGNIVLKGGTITGNNGAKGAVYSDSDIKVQGTVVVKENQPANIYLAGTSALVVSGAMTNSDISFTQEKAADKQVAVKSVENFAAADFNTAVGQIKYDTTDYTKIDPAFGDEETMKALCREAHEKGIRIMVDAVFNHCGRKFAPWVDVLEHGKDSRYADWFMIEDWEQIGKRADTRDRRFYSFAFTDAMPKLNTNNEEVIEYFCKVCEEWIRKFDIDGIRFDVGNEVSHRFLKRIREHLKAVKPDLYLLGEIWHDASQWLQGDEYDSVMNYPLLSGIHDFFLDKTMKKEEFEYMVNRCYTMYMQQNNDVLFNLLDSHDTERLMNRFHDLDKFYQQLAILFTLPGSPCIYYGTEIAMEGAHDPDCRRCMPWSEINSEENQEKIATMRKLIMLRRNEKTCRSPHFHFPDTYENDRCVEYIKIDEEGNKMEVLLNTSEKEIKVKEAGEVLFAREFDGEILGVNGTLIRRI